MGMIALTDLGKNSYKGEQGGLYPGGENSPPREHLKAGLEIAKRVVPLNAEGYPAADGKIALLLVGMSNTTIEYQTFMKRAAEDKELNPRLVLVTARRTASRLWKPPMRTPITGRWWISG